MEVDDIQTPQQARKFSRVNSNGARIDSSKIALEPPTTTTQDNKTHPTTTTTSAAAATTSTTTDLVAATANRLRQWPHHQSRIIRVSRASGGKDRHSKVWTARGPRDRRVRLSVNTAIQFYDLQDRLGYEQPSKAVEWLIKAAADAINELPSLDTCATFPPDTPCQLTHNPTMAENNNNSANRDPDGEDNDPTHPGQNPASKSGCSSNNSENSKGSSGLSLSRTEIRVKARERARERTAKEKEKDSGGGGSDQAAPARVHVSGGHHQTSSFTQLLTAGISSSPASSSPPGNASLSPDVGLFHHKHTRGGTTTTTTTTTATATTTANQWLASNITAMDYFGNAAGGLLGSSSSSSSRQMQQQQIPQAMAISPHSLHHQQHNQQFPFVSGAGDHLIQVLPNNHHNTAAGGGGGNVYNFNFSISSSTATSSGAGYNNRGTLQSNSPSLLPYLQRFSTTDGLSSVPFFLGGAPVSSTSDDHHHHQFQPPGLQLCYGDGARHQSDHKGTTKN